MRRAEIYTASILFLLLAACGGDDDSAGDDDDGGDAAGDVMAFISEVQLGDGAAAESRTGERPDEGGGPTASVTSSGTVINGGSVMVQIEGDGDFDRVVVAIDGAGGYFEASLPAAVASVELLITLSQEIGANQFAFLYAVGSGDEIGAYAEVEATVVSVGTGELQVSVSWDAASDVDLHVVDPDGDEVFYGVPTVASGGELDLDSNAGCFIDNVNNENITWATAPDGTYTVRLDYFADCDVAESNYAVTVQRVGHDAETFSGTFTGAGDLGGAGSGIEITTFTMP
jgi:uncharacterized protein YfaP (DUF2135 family)